MRLFHGCNKRLTKLKKGTYVTKSRREAEKFGYRRAVMEDSMKVFVMEFDMDEDLLIRDETRDRAYQITEDTACNVVAEYWTYDTPNKLTVFKK